MPTEPVKIPFEKKRWMDGLLDRPEPVVDPQPTSVIMAHGAANDMHEPLLRHLASGLCRAGYPVLRFNFPYRSEGRQSPDSQKVLEAAWLKAAEWMRSAAGPTAGRLMAGGKSLGARIVSQLAGAGRLSVDGLAFWGYPLHAPGRRHQLRDAHLDAITCPLLFVSGSRDPFCDLSLLRGVVDRLGRRAALEVVEGGDHSFRLPKPFREEDRQAVYDRILARTREWLDHL